MTSTGKPTKGKKGPGKLNLKKGKKKPSAGDVDEEEDPDHVPEKTLTSHGSDLEIGNQRLRKNFRNKPKTASNNPRFVLSAHIYRFTTRDIFAHISTGEKKSCFGRRKFLVFGCFFFVKLETETEDSAYLH